MPVRNPEYERTRELTPEDCNEFRANPSINPLTGRTIQPNGPLARYIRARCDENIAASASRRTSPSPPPTPRFPLVPLIHPQGELLGPLLDRDDVRRRLFEIGRHRAIQSLESFNLTDMRAPSFRGFSRETIDYVESAIRQFGQEWVFFFITAGRQNNPELLDLPEQLPYEPPPAPHSPAQVISFHGVEIPIQRVREILYTIGVHQIGRNRLTTYVAPELSPTPLLPADPISLEFIRRTVRIFGLAWHNYYIQAGEQGLENRVRPLLPPPEPLTEDNEMGMLNPLLRNNNYIVFPTVRVQRILWNIGRARATNNYIRIQEIQDLNGISMNLFPHNQVIQSFVNRATSFYGEAWVNYYIRAGVANDRSRLPLTENQGRPAQMDVRTFMSESSNNIPSSPYDPNEPPLPDRISGMNFIYDDRDRISLGQVRYILRNQQSHPVIPSQRYNELLEYLTNYFNRYNNRNTDWIAYHLENGPVLEELTRIAGTASREDIAQLRTHMSPATYARLLEIYRNIYPNRSPITPEVQRKRVASPKADAPPSPEDPIHATCAEIFAGMEAPEFKKLVYKLKRICSGLKKQCAAEKIAAIRQHIQNPFNTTFIRIHTKVDNIWRNVVYSHFSISPPRVSGPYEKLFLGTWDQLEVLYEDSPATGVGTKLNYIQQLLEGIRADRFFVPAEPGSSRSIVNPKMTVEYLESLGYIFNLGDVDKKTAIQNIYEWIGRICAFCARMDVPTEIYLSRGVLERLVYKTDEIAPEEDIMYFLSESPESRPGVLNLLRVPVHIEAVGLEVNDDGFEPPLFKENAPLTTDNFVEYLTRKARHLMGGTDERLKALCRGFYIRNKLRSLPEAITVSEIDALLCGNPISLESIRKWVGTGSGDSERIITSLHITPAQHAIYNWLLEILRSSGEGFPYDEIPEAPEVLRLREQGLSSPERRSRKKAVFVEFVRKLVAFWSGLTKLNMTRTYQVIFIDGPMPRAATCFYQLKLPSSISSKEDLYRKLVLAVFSVESGLGFLGGKSRRTKSQPRIIDIYVSPMPRK